MTKIHIRDKFKKKTILFLLINVVHVNHRSARSLSLLMMDIPCLLTVIVGLTLTKVEGNTNIVGKPPPRPGKGLSNVKRQ